MSGLEAPVDRLHRYIDHPLRHFPNFLLAVEFNYAYLVVIQIFRRRGTLGARHDFEARIEAASEAGRKSILLLVRRGGDPRFVALVLEN